MTRWVKLPDDAQVTMSRESWESTQGLSPLSKIGIGAAIVAVIFVMGGGCHADKKGDQPNPTPSVSAPAKVSH